MQYRNRFLTVGLSSWLVIGFLVYCLPAQAISYGGIGGRPAFPRTDNPRTADIFVRTLQPGAIADEGVYVINSTDQQKKLMVYSADSTPSTEGGFACKQLAESNQPLAATKQGVGSWVQFKLFDQTASTSLNPADDQDQDGLSNGQELAHDTNPYNQDTDGDGFTDKQEVDSGYDPLQPVVITLAAGSQQLLPFTISAPQTADVGEHDGCILIQEKKDQQAGQAGITLATRTGLRVAVTVPGDIVRLLAIRGLDVLPGANGGKIIRPQVENTGNVSIDAEVQVITRDIFGRAVITHGGAYSILRGDATSWNYEIPASFWGGWYTSGLTVSYDANQQATTGADTAGAKTTLTATTKRYFMAPSVAAVIIYSCVVLFFILVIGLWIWAVKRKKLIATTWVPYTVAEGDDIKLLAHAGLVSW